MANWKYQQMPGSKGMYDLPCTDVRTESRSKVRLAHLHCYSFDREDFTEPVVRSYREDARQQNPNFSFQLVETYCAFSRFADRERSKMNQLVYRAARLLLPVDRYFLLDLRFSYFSTTSTSIRLLFAETRCQFRLE